MQGNAEPIYLDHAATTPVRAEVIAAMSECHAEGFGNPSSGHSWGRRARRRLEWARASLATALDVPAANVFFTRGGTESDNLAILGRARNAIASGGRAPLVVTSSIEHPAVFEAAEQAAVEGARHAVIGFSGGVFDVDALKAAVRERPVVVSCMWVNNEIGLELPMAEVSEVCREREVVLHSDAVQAVGKIPVSLRDNPVDLLTVTGHKIHGPTGTGALIATDPRGLQPLHFGGGQERGVRPGTEDVAGAVGLAEALRLAVEEVAAESTRLGAMRDTVQARLVARAPDLRINGEGLPRAPHILSLGIPGTDSDTLLAALDAQGIAASGGSACASGSSAPSRTLATLYPGEAAATLRLSFGHLNLERQVDRIVDAVATAIERTRELVRQ
ncbi:MAG: cysteine desulfurase family protein [Gemmatimonadota bacterium]|nr:cysteine desulfurase family protein [Gemmatimonadota bacterium]